MVTFALPFLLPAAIAVVSRVGGQLVVRQYLKNGFKNIAIRNAKLAGKKHPTTGVSFTKEGFPSFKSMHTMTIPNSVLKSSSTTQFSRANANLKTAFNNSATVRNKFTASQRSDILNGKTPRGYVWHHHQNRGRMQLVNKSIHEKTGHTGGKAIWGTLE